MLHSNLVLGVAAFSPGGSPGYADGSAAEEHVTEKHVPEVPAPALGWDSSLPNHTPSLPYASSVPLDHDFLTPLVAPTGGAAARKIMDLTIMSMAGPPASAGTTYFVWDGEDVLVETHGTDSVWIN